MYLKVEAEREKNSKVNFYSTVEIKLNVTNPVEINLNMAHLVEKSWIQKLFSFIEEKLSVKHKIIQVE